MYGVSWTDRPGTHNIDPIGILYAVVAISGGANYWTDATIHQICLTSIG
jgi:hypothetical protein